MGGTVIGKLRDPVGGLMHLAAAVAAAVGSGGLVCLGRDAGVKLVSLLVYGSSLVLMFSSSAAYHLVRSGPRLSELLRKLDHSAIYLLIAGTYTPICLHFFSGFWRWGLLGVIWGMAGIGIGVKVFVINAPRWLTAGVYLLMGWLSLLAIREILVAMPVTALVWLLLGGFFFTAGAIVYVTKKPDFFPGVFGFHEVWHIFVILGCLSHFILVAAFIAARPLSS
jgi:hemolysin III